MVSDERYLDELDAKYERLRASSTCLQCAFAEPMEPDMGYMRLQAERFMQLVRPAEGTTRTVDSLTSELTMLLYNEAANVCLCNAFNYLVTGDAPAEDCPDFEPADTGWSQ